MIDRVLKLKPILTLLFIQNEDYKKKKISENMWETLEDLRNLLKPFFSAMIDPRLKFEYFEDYHNIILLKEKFFDFYEQNYKSQISTQESNNGESVTFKESLYSIRK